MRILVPHVGFTQGNRKSAVIAGLPEGEIPRALLISLEGGKSVEITCSKAERVGNWFGNCFSVADFSSCDVPGPYRISVELAGEAVRSEVFCIDIETPLSRGASDVLSAFRSLRSFGEIDRKDRQAGFFAHPELGAVDASGGWLDASGDFSKFLSHLTYTPTMSPQQIPLCAWAFFEARSRLQKHHPRFAKSLGSKLRDEGLFGADFLVRFHDPKGFFYTGIFDGLTKDLNERLINAPLPECVRTDRFQASYRAGGGLAIAALARASQMEQDGDFLRSDYLKIAVGAFLDLERNNEKYLFGLDTETGILIESSESIVDDYCALLAATELFAADPSALYAEAASRRCHNLISRYRADEEGKSGWLEAWEDGRPWFSNVESGFPVVALMRFAEVFSDDDAFATSTSESRELVLGAESLMAADLVPAAQLMATKIMEDLLERTSAVPNPFGYPRARVVETGAEAPRDVRPRDSFFIPHTNETGYWWQGENANLASLSHAASRVSTLETISEELRGRLQVFAINQVEWILGRNPYDSCMLQGRGRNNVEYMTEYPNIPGGIVNGITADPNDSESTAFVFDQPTDSPDGWRWAEQWIPHSAWYLLVLSTLPGTVF